MPNSAPAGTRLTLTIPRSDTLRQNGFGHSSAAGDAFQAMIISLPGSGTLYCDANGAPGGERTAIVTRQTIAAADILAGELTCRAP